MCETIARLARSNHSLPTPQKYTMSDTQNPKILDLRAKGSRAVQSFMRTFGPDDTSPDSIPMTEKTSKKDRPKRYVNPKTGKEISRLKSVVVDNRGNVLMKRLITLSLVGGERQRGAQ